MNRSIGSLLLGAASLAAVAELMGVPGTPNVHATSLKGEEKAPLPMSSAEKLKVRLGKGDGDLLDPGNKRWEAAPATRVLLNRTPRVYQTEKPAPARPTTLEVRAVRAGKQVIFRLMWEDATRNAPAAPPKRKGDGGDPARLYKRPTGATAAFADAAAVMVPESFQGGEFPSLVMGDAHGPVRLYYWSASRGAEELTAAGRARVEGTGKAFRHQARHDARRWAVTLEMPELPTPSPVAFAVWDGEAADRNGLKMFSIWYVLE